MKRNQHITNLRHLVSGVCFFNLYFLLSTFSSVACPESGYRYQESAAGKLQCLDLKESASLPDALAKGTKGYDDVKHCL